MAKKLPYLWWSNPAAFPERVLALDLLSPTEPDEDGRRYRFEFVDEDRIGLNDDRLWFRVSKVLDLEGGPDMHDWLINQGLQMDQLSRAYRTLDRLHRAIRIDQVVAWYEETTQDIEQCCRSSSGATGVELPCLIPTCC